MEKLPVYEMIINTEENSDVEVSFMALVDKPAIERNFLAFYDDDFGGPGSGRHPEGGGDSGNEDAAAVSKIPREKRTEEQIKTLLKTKPKQYVKELVQGGKEWIKNNPDKVGTIEHRTISREVNVGDKILKGYYSLQFAINEEKRIISGPAMVAGSLIYRKDENGEYNVFFSKETIREIALKFFKKDYQKNINLFHDLPVGGVTIFESFVSDSERGIQPMKGFEDLPDGSWFISAKIDNEDVWQKIKSGEVKGFSVEGIFSYVRKPSGKENQNSHLYEKTIMSEITELWNKFKEKFIGEVNQTTQKLATDYQLKDGTPVSIDKIEAGGVVMLNGQPAPAGQYELADGTMLMVGEGGVISEIMAAAPAAPAVDYTKQFSAIDEKFAAYEARFTETTGQLNKLSEAFTKQSESLQSLIGIVGKIVEAPTADPVGDGHKKFQTDKETSKEEKRKELAELFKKIKNK